MMKSFASFIMALMIAVICCMLTLSFSTCVRGSISIPNSLKYPLTILFCSALRRSAERVSSWPRKMLSAMLSERARGSSW